LDIKEGPIFPSRIFLISKLGVPIFLLIEEDIVATLTESGLTLKVLRLITNVLNEFASGKS